MSLRQQSIGFVQDIETDLWDIGGALGQSRTSEHERTYPRKVQLSGGNEVVEPPRGPTDNVHSVL